MTLNVLLSGVVGSTAYGLAGPGSDVDRLGIFAAPTLQLLGLGKPKQTFVTTNPDVTMHEVGKWCRLALRCNPTVLELVWLDEQMYDRITPRGWELVSLRAAFLSASQVRSTYLGYARGQFDRLRRRGDGSFSADLRKRTGKHARHLGRLLHQGLTLYTQGHLPVRLPPHIVGRCQGLGALAEEGDMTGVELTLAGYERQFDRCTSALPERPDAELVERWVRQTRRDLLRVDFPDVETENGDS